MSQSPPATLVRLREADVVRLCGLEAAARGLELASRRAVSATRRTGPRLEAAVLDGSEECRAWVELVGEVSPSAMHWECRCHAHAPPAQQEGCPPAHTHALACAHVAAILTAWIHSPGDFVEPAAASAPAPSPPSDAPLEPYEPRPRVTQPALLSSPAFRRPRAGSSLHDELARLATHDVLAMGRRVLGGEPDEHDVRAALAHTLSDPAALTPILDRLDAGARELLGDVMVLGGAITVADLDALAQRAGRPPSAMHGSMSVLERHGLVFPQTGLTTQGAAGASPWRRIAGWRVPPEVRAALTSASSRLPLPLAGLSPLSAAQHGMSGSAPARVARVRRASARPLALVLALLARAPEPYRVSSTPSRAREPVPSVPLSARHRAVPLLAGELDARALAEVARGAGVAPAQVRLARRVLLWARESGGSPVSDLAAVPAAERLYALRDGFRLWAASDSPAELADLQLPDSPVHLVIAPEHAAWHPGLLAQEAAEARAFVLRLVRDLQPGVWYAFDTFLDALWRVHPLFLRGRQAAFAQPAWWLERAQERRPLRAHVRDEWRAGEGEYVRALLTGPLHFWGALDLGFDASGALAAFRLTPLGQLLFDRPDAPALSALAPLDDSQAAPVLPMRDGALALHPLAAGVALLDTLAPWAAPTAIAGGRLVYTLSPDLACAAFDTGATPESLLVRLRVLDVSGQARLAARVRTRLQAWREQYGTTRIAAGWALLEAEDEATLVEALAAVPQVSARCRRVGQAVALVPPVDVPALQAVLARRIARL